MSMVDQFIHVDGASTSVLRPRIIYTLPLAIMYWIWQVHGGLLEAPLYPLKSHVSRGRPLFHGGQAPSGPSVIRPLLMFYRWAVQRSAHFSILCPQDNNGNFLQKIWYKLLFTRSTDFSSKCTTNRSAAGLRICPQAGAVSRIRRRIFVRRKSAEKTSASRIRDTHANSPSFLHVKSAENT